MGANDRIAAHTKDYEPSKAKPNGAASPAYEVRAPSEWSWRAAELTLIEGMAAPRSLIWAYAPSGHGKTLVALNLAWHIARSQDRWYGRRITPGLVVYVAAEGPASVELRLHALARYHDTEFTDDIHLRLIRDPVDLHDPEALIDTITGLEQELDQTCVRVVLDTVSQLLAAAGEAENDTGMGAVLTFCNAIRRDTRAAVLALHHTPLADPKRSRGHGASANAADARWLISKARNDVITLRVEHSKDGAPGTELRFSVRTATVGLGALGMPVQGPLAAPTSEPPEPDAKLDPRQSLMVQALAVQGRMAGAWTFDRPLFKTLMEQCGAWDAEARSTLGQAAANMRRSLQTRRILVDFDAASGTATLAASWRDYGRPPEFADLAEQINEAVSDLAEGATAEAGGAAARPGGDDIAARARAEDRASAAGDARSLKLARDRARAAAEARAANGPARAGPRVKVGDRVQWTCGGIDQLAGGARVKGVSACGDYVFIEGTATGLPIAEVTVLAEGRRPDPPAPEG